MGHRLGLATRTQISVCKSPLPSAGTAVSLFHAKTVQQLKGSYKPHDTNIPVWFWLLAQCWAISKTDARKIDALNQWCLRMLLGIKWYLFVWNNDVWRLTKQPKLYCYNPIAPAYPVWAYYAHGRQCRCQEDPVSLPSGRLKKTTRSSRITWLSTVQQYLKQHVTLPEAPDLAQNRPLWWMMSTYGATQS